MQMHNDDAFRFTDHVCHRWLLTLCFEYISFPWLCTRWWVRDFSKRFNNRLIFFYTLSPFISGITNMMTRVNSACPYGNNNPVSLPFVDFSHENSYHFSRYTVSVVKARDKKWKDKVKEVQSWSHYAFLPLSIKFDNVRPLPFTIQHTTWSSLIDYYTKI